MSVQLAETIFLMAVVTYGARVLPFLLFKGKNVQGFARDFIELVPIALLAALVVPELVTSGGTISVLHNPFLWTGILTFLFSRFVPNLFLGIVFGMAMFWGLDKFLA
ncbi:putative membrane protein [Desulfosporosinus orientis DSM 765]|uniref:Putative membrane protein n=1 Tax=Desulfosporosinus orientis (strain ATCC 19365 / DSM 765 / NCIMB 8382 / VKM B-1628 / Singapore I) TaxID=768706 RepID=G7WAN3_DESOD|nr:AzlD domain-containing protein [Desulfosporosinus orientis]AET66801.1 putative membrane protein [Desulfosporosinus orientis DSM 765]